MCLSRLRELWRMYRRGLVRVKIIENSKREYPFDVRDVFLLLPQPQALRILDQIREVYPGKVEVIRVFEWVCKNIRVACGVVDDYWKQPSETLVDGCGDCMDGSILFANLLVQAGFGDRVFIEIYDVGDKVFHAVVRVDDHVFDWTRECEITIPVGWRLWYCWNRKNAYTLKENVCKWRRP